MTLIAFLIATGRALLAATPLAGGATTDPRFGVEIATDAAKLRPAQQYWTARFSDISNGPFVWSPQPPWLEFALQAWSVANAPWVAQRDAIRTRNDYDETVTTNRNKGRVIPDLEALIAASGIATFIGTTETPPKDDLTQSLLLAAVARAFTAPGAAAADSDDARVIGRGLRAARELHDAGQRFEFARAHATLFNGTVTFAEALALHRAEGAFCMPPPLESLSCAPLILTQPTLPPPHDSTQLSARTESVYASIGARTFTRPGYISTVAGALQNNETRDLVVLFANGLGIGGLDNLMSWPVTLDSPKDELSLLFVKAVADNIAGIRPFLRSWTAALSLDDQNTLAYASVGIAMAHLEADPAIDGDTLIAKVVADLTAVRIYNPMTNPDGSLAILDDNARANTKKFLELSTRWYASRTRPETLLARRDRAGFTSTPMNRLSPYMAYLRYHSGDVIFFGLVLRAARELAALRAKWTAAMGRASFAAAVNGMSGADFGASLAASGFDSMTPSDTGTIENSLALWRNNTSGALYRMGEGESVWRHVGLLATIVAPWKPPSPDPADTQKVRGLADAVLAAMTVIHDRELLEPISLALEYMPVKPMFQIATFNEKNWAANLRKSENFERLRLFADEARQRVGLNDRGDRPS